MIVLNGREKKTLFLSLTSLLNSRKPPMPTRQSPSFDSSIRYLANTITPSVRLPRTDMADELSRIPSASSLNPMTMHSRRHRPSTNTCRQVLLIIAPHIITNVTSISKPQLPLQTMPHSFIHTYLRHPASGISSQRSNALREPISPNVPSSLGDRFKGVRGASLCSENFRTRVSRLGFPLFMSPS